MRGPLLCASILLRTWIAILNAANNVLVCMPTASIHYTTASTCLQSNNNNKRKLGGPWNSWPTCTLILGTAHPPSQSSSVLPSRCLVLSSLSLRFSSHLLTENTDHTIMTIMICSSLYHLDLAALLQSINVGLETRSS